MTPPTKKHSLPNQKRVPSSLLFFLSVIITTLPTKTNAQLGCPNDCDPCIGRNVNYIQCPTTDCAQFVQCSDGKTSQTFTCAAGLMFDAGTSSCGWVDPTIQGVTCGPDPVCNDPPDPADTGCEIIGGSECATPCADQSDGLYQVAGTNRKKYVFCSYGAVVSGYPKTCDGDMLFDSNLKVCNFPDQVTCGDDPVCNPEPDPADIGCEDIGGSECATPCADQSDGLYQVAGTNRKKYVFCSYGAVVSGYPKTCEGDTLFDSNLKICNFPDQVTCGDDPVCNPEPDPADIGCEDIGGSECATPCADQSDGLYQVAGTNRKKYVFCSYGAVVSGYPKTCEGDTLFDSNLKICNFPDQVTCGDDPVCNPEPDPADIGCEDIGGSECATPCADQSDGLYQVAGTNRKKYVFCSYGAVVSGYPKTCEGDTLFDSNLKICNFPDQVTCGDDPVCNPEPDPADIGCEDIGGSECATPCADQSDGLYQVAGTNRKKYVFCSYGAVVSGYPKTCEGDTLFDSNLKICNFPDQVTCGDDPVCNPEPDPADIGCEDIGGSECATPCADQSDGLYQVAGTNRKKYVFCSYGAVVSGYPKTCEGDTLFDSNLKICNFPDQVTCGDDPVCNPEPDPADIGCEDIGGSECATPCADQSDGLYQVAGTNRKKYVFCSYGAVVSGYPKTCDGDMLFDSSLKVCNFPDRVTCGDDPVCNPEPDPADIGCEDIGGSECATPCGGKSPGIYQLPGSNRKKYVICSYGSTATVEVSQTVECGDGLLFDSSLNVCNFLASVNCGPDPSCDQPTPVNADLLRGVTMFSSNPDDGETNGSCPRTLLKLASAGIILLHAFLLAR